MNSWASRIKVRMKELGLTQAELASRLGITRSAITHYITGRRIPPLKQFEKLSLVLKTDPGWLQFGIINDAATSHETTSHTLPIPIFTWEQATKLCKSGHQVKPSAIKEWLPHFYTEKRHWYGLRIQGDSMTSTTAPSFSENDIIIVDSEKEVEPGDFVIALANSKELMFKQFVVDAGIKYLKPLNPQYPIMPIDKNTKIYGIVIMRFSSFIN